MNVTILLCGGPMSGKTMLARVLVEMLREQGFGVAYSEVSVPPVYVGGVVERVGEVLVVTDPTPPKSVRSSSARQTERLEDAVAAPPGGWEEYRKAT